MITFIEHYQLNENMTSKQIDEVEKFADKLFGKLNIDVDLSGRHLYDRINDSRNGKPITAPELIAMFKKTFRKHGKDIKKMGAGIQAVIKDTNTDLNLPFMLKWDKKTDELDLVAKTVMRKKKFQTSNQTLEV